MPVSRVEFTRGGHVESVHRLRWCATAPDGAIAVESDPGAAAAPVFPRSAAKPLQALAAVRAGVLERFGLGARHLALACASHGGAAIHITGVREVLTAIGMGEGDLACGPLEPRDPAAAAALRTRGQAPSRIVHNCSGKHALALAHCRGRDWPAGGYTQPEHPVQQGMRAAVAEAAGLAPADLAWGGDGCGMPAVVLPLGALAAAFGRLAAGGLGAAGDRAAAAMRAHPELVAFDGALDTELMRACAGLVAKVGAEGVLAAGLPDGRGLAVKVVDGAMRALDPAGVALVRDVLGEPGSSPALAALAEPVLTNSRGETVGRGRAVAGHTTI